MNVSPSNQSSTRHRVVIIGGGFGGLTTARALRKAPVQVTLVDRRNFHLFQPLLYQVATGALSPANIAAPLRSILERQKNCEIVLGNVTAFDVAGHQVLLADGTLPYDSLIVAAGARHSYFGHDDWEPLAPGLKTIEDATDIRRRLLMAFERAERETDPVRRQELLNFVIVGGGPTGVELAGAVAEMSRYGLRHEFSHIDPGDAEVTLVEAGPRILASYPPELSQHAQDALVRIGVTVRTNTKVSSIGDNHVLVKSGGQTDRLATRTVLWAAGVAASPLAKELAEGTGASLDRTGRIVVEPDLSIAGHPDVFAIGDMASYTHQGDEPLPGVAPVAIQQGKFVAQLIMARLKGKRLPEFHYRDLGSLATIGRSSAVVAFGKLQFGGFFAWLLWLFIHLMKLVGHRNRVLVFVQWAWNYLTYDRSSGLITGEWKNEFVEEGT